MQTPRTRRPRLSYANVTATLALVIATSMGGAYAHGKIGSNQLKQNAVKSRHIGSGQVKTPDLSGGAVKAAKLANSAVTPAKLHPTARGSNVTLWSHGAHNFAADDTIDLRLPGVTKAQVFDSGWQFQVVSVAFSGVTVVSTLDTSRATGSDEATGKVGWIDGFGAAVEIDGGDQFNGSVQGVRVIQTTPNRSQNPVLLRSGAPRLTR